MTRLGPGLCSCVDLALRQPEDLHFGELEHVFQRFLAVGTVLCYLDSDVASPYRTRLALEEQQGFFFDASFFVILAACVALEVHVIVLGGDRHGSHANVEVVEPVTCMMKYLLLLRFDVT